MFWRRQQSDMTATTTSDKTSETAKTEPTPISEQPIGNATTAGTATPPDEMAIFDAVHVPTATEGETRPMPAMVNPSAFPEASVAPTTFETETASDRQGDKGKPAKGQVEAAEKAKGGGGAFAFGLIVGAGLGAAAALLFAPKSGEEMRSELVETGMSLRNQGSGASGTDWRPTANPWAGQAADAVQEAASAAETTLRDATTDAQQTASDLKDDAEDRLQKF